jgi:hypothetical protein
MEKNATMCEAKGGKETVPVDLIFTVVAMWVVSLGGLFYVFKRVRPPLTSPLDQIGHLASATLSPLRRTRLSLASSSPSLP